MRIVAKRLLPPFVAFGFASCAFDENPLARHDLDGDGVISHSEYLQNHIQYNNASRQRVDDYNRILPATSHLGVVGDRSEKEADRKSKILKNSPRGPNPKAVPDPKELNTPAKDL